MKNKILIITALCFCIFSSYSNPYDSVKINSLSKTVSNLSDQVKNIKIENEQTKLREEKKEKGKGEEMEHLVFLLKLATWGVDALVLLSALFAVYHFWSFDREKKKVKEKLKELEEKQIQMNELSRQIFAMEKKIFNAQDYNKHGFDNLFAFIEEYINNRRGEQKTKDLLQLKRGIIYTYDDDAETRKKGIYMISQYGNLDDIKRLEEIITDLQEAPENKIVAREASIMIRDRFKLFSALEDERYEAICVRFQNGITDDILDLERIINNESECERNKELAQKAIEAIKLRGKK